MQNSVIYLALSKKMREIKGKGQKKKKTGYFTKMCLFFFPKRRRKDTDTKTLDAKKIENETIKEKVQKKKADKQKQQNKKTKKVSIFRLLFFVSFSFLVLIMGTRYYYSIKKMNAGTKQNKKTSQQKDYKAYFKKAIAKEGRKDLQNKTNNKKSDIENILSGKKKQKKEKSFGVNFDEKAIRNIQQQEKKSVDRDNNTSSEQNKNTSNISLFRQFCNANKYKIREGITFLTGDNYDFSYLGKKYKKGDKFDQIGRQGVIISSVHFSDPTHRTVVISNSKNETCNIKIAWDKGLKIKVFYDAIEVRESLTSNTYTFLVGDSFSGVKLLDIDNSKQAHFQDEAGDFMYRGNKK